MFVYISSYSYTKCFQIESVMKTCVKGEYQSTLLNIKHYLRHEKKVNKNKLLTYCEALVDMYVQT